MMMDRRTFLKAVGVSVAGALLPAVPGAEKDRVLTFRGVPIVSVPNLAGKSADYLIFTSTPIGNNSFFDQCFIEESYRDAEGLRAGVIPDWMMKRGRLEEQGVDFGDNMACGMTPPVQHIHKEK